MVYFHGAPGSVAECAVFDQYAKDNQLRFICFDRFSIDSALRGSLYYQHLSDAVKKIANGQQVDVVGFSIGAHVAIEVCLLLGDRVRSLHLVSAAAPLDAGEFLDKMAGKIIFSLAAKHPLIFSLVSRWQGLLARFAPNALYTMLFASATGGDRVLSENSDFRHVILSVLDSSFQISVKGYMRDVQQYVKPWKKSVSTLATTSSIWHGSTDNWSPVEMAHYLSEALVDCSGVELMEGLSHYSCLFEAAPKICSQLGR